MLQLADRVKETTTTTGTGALALAGAITGFRAFSAVCADQDTCWYAIQGVTSSGTPTNEWEVGVGTYTASGNTLARTTVLASSNAGAAVNLSAGTKQVWIGQAAGKVAAPAAGLLDVVPSLASMNQINQSNTGAIVSQQDFGISVNVPKMATPQIFALTKAFTVSGSWKVRARIRSVIINNNYPSTGVCLYDSGSGKLKLFEYSYQSNLSLFVGNFTNVSTFSSNAFNVAITTAMEWLQIRSDGTNWYYEVSPDGVSWVTVYQEAVNTFLTPNQGGFFSYVGSTYGLACSIHSLYAGA